MGNTTNLENWAARERLRVIELLLWWRGWVGRGDLLQVFGISAAQASGDLQRYVELNGDAMVYHTSRKRYEATPEMRCVRHEPRLQDALSFFFGWEGVSNHLQGDANASKQLAALTLPARKVLSQVERRVMIALLAGAECRVMYHSVSSGKAAWRVLVPGALGWDGRRWHLRAFAREHGEWRDYVLGRMTQVEWPGDKAKDLPVDKDWERIEEVVLRLNPKLSEEQKAALRLDYAMEGDELRVKVRSAMKRYLMAEMLLTPDGDDSPRHFVSGE